MDVSGTLALPALTADVELGLAGIDVALAQAWISADAPLEPSRGTLGGTVNLRYTRGGSLVAGGTLRLTDLAVSRTGQPGPFVREERIVVTFGDVKMGEGRVELGRVAVSGSPTVIAPAGGATQRLHIPHLRLVLEGGGFPGSAPAQLRLQATLPHGGALQATGTAALDPAALTLKVRARDVDLAVAAPWIPERAPVALERGRLDADLSVGWDDALRAAGRLVARDAVLLRDGQAVPFIRHPSLEVALRGLVLRDGQLTVERVQVEGTPTIVDATAKPPQRFDVQALTLTVTDFSWPGRRPAQLHGQARVAHGGSAELRGEIHPGTLQGETRIRFDNVDVTRARGYVPAGTPLAIDDGRAEATVTLRHRRGDPVRLDAEGALHDLRLRVLVGPGVHLRDQRIAFEMDGLTIGDGVT